MKISLLTGCNDKHYQLCLTSGLIKNDIRVDFIANDDMVEAAKYPKVTYFNFRGDQDRKAPITAKLLRIARYYWKLIAYAATTDSKIFHIQWMNRFVLFDRTALNLYYKVTGKKLVYTAHNVNERARDGGDTVINRWSLKFMYHLVDQIIVHTEKMKKQLVDDFNIAAGKISVIQHGLYDVIPQTSMGRQLAREKLQLQDKHRTLLFFGNIAPYKGLEYLLLALAKLKETGKMYKVIIAGKIKNCPEYWEQMEAIIREKHLEECIIRRTEFIPDEDIEIYFKGCDVLILPYTYIFQSGILFLAYDFGLPIVASDVGSLKEDIIEGKTGYIFSPCDSEDLANKITNYFESDIYKNLDQHRREIIDYAKDKYSWSEVGKKTYAVYEKLLV